MTDKRIKINEDDTISLSDLKYILDINQKSISIYLEVEKQNDLILKSLENFKYIYEQRVEKLETLNISCNEIKELLKDDNNHDHNLILEKIKELNNKIDTPLENISYIKNNIDYLDEFKNKLSEIDKNLFRLVIILGSLGVGTIFAIVQMFIHK